MLIFYMGKVQILLVLFVSAVNILPKYLSIVDGYKEFK